LGKSSSSTWFRKLSTLSGIIRRAPFSEVLKPQSSRRLFVYALTPQLFSQTEQDLKKAKPECARQVAALSDNDETLKVDTANMDHETYQSNEMNNHDKHRYVGKEIVHADTYVDRKYIRRSIVAPLEEANVS
jgi:hypothetical protein